MVLKKWLWMSMGMILIPTFSFAASEPEVSGITGQQTVTGTFREQGNGTRRVSGPHAFDPSEIPEPWNTHRDHINTMAALPDSGFIDMGFGSALTLTTGTYKYGGGVALRMGTITIDGDVVIYLPPRRGAPVTTFEGYLFVNNGNIIVTPGSSLVVYCERVEISNAADLSLERGLLNQNGTGHPEAVRLFALGHVALHQMRAICIVHASSLTLHHYTHLYGAAVLSSEDDCIYIGARAAIHFAKNMSIPGEGNYRLQWSRRTD